MATPYTAEFVLAKFQAASDAYDQALAAQSSSLGDPQTQASVTRQRLERLSAEMDKWASLYDRLTAGTGKIKLRSAVPHDA